MAFRFTHDALTRFLELEAAAARISLPEYQKTLFEVWHGSETGKPRFRSPHAMMRWFETEEGSQALMELIHQWDAVRSWQRLHRHLAQANSRTVTVQHSPSASTDSAIRLRADEWESLNNERMNLIEKDVHEGLTEAEKIRLQELENVVFSELDRVAPLTFPQASDVGS